MRLIKFTPYKKDTKYKKFKPEIQPENKLS